MIALIALALAAPMAPQPPLHLAAQEAPVPVEEWQLDQVRIDKATDAAVLKALEPAHTMAEVVATLDRLHVTYQHTPAVILPSRMPADMREQIEHLPQGEPFVIPEGPFISISVIVGRKLPPGTVRYQPRAAPFTRSREA